MNYPKLEATLNKVFKPEFVSVLISELVEEARSSDLDLEDSSSLMAAFVWRKSSRGFKFWSNAHQMAKAK